MTSIEGFRQIRGGYSFYTRKTDNIADGETFADALTETADDDIMAKASDKWVTEPGISFDAMKIALEFRRNELGIKDTEPTYELTPEQREWIYSRHDLSTMQTHIRYSYDYGGTTQYRTEATAEYRNFVADLVYLGVIAPEDLLHVAPIDTRPGGYSVLLSGYIDKVRNSDGSVLTTTRLFVEHLQNMFDFYNERSKNPLLAMEGDAEFAAMIKERFLSSQMRFLEFIEELFGSKDEELPQSSIAPPIEDASEKLKEDFGGKL